MGDIKATVTIREDNEHARKTIADTLKREGIEAEVYRNDTELDDEYSVTARRSIFFRVCGVVESALHGEMLIGTANTHHPAIT